MLISSGIVLGLPSVGRISDGIACLLTGCHLILTMPEQYDSWCSLPHSELFEGLLDNINFVTFDTNMRRFHLGDFVTRRRKMNFRGQANGFPLSEKFAEPSVIGILETMLSFALETKYLWVEISSKSMLVKDTVLSLLPSPSPLICLICPRLI